MTQQPLTHDIIISGGGMVGLALALAVAKSGLNVAVIEKQPAQKPSNVSDEFSPRVSAINHASERLLKHLGAWQKIPNNRLSAYHQMRVWDGQGTGALTFSAAEVQSSHLGHIIENNQIVDAFWQCVYEQTNIDIYLQQTVERITQTERDVQIELSNGDNLSAALLVGAEGKFSAIRQLAGIKTTDWDYDHTAIVTTVKHEKSHEQCAQQVFLESGPLAFLPLSSEDTSNQYSSIVWSTDPQNATHLLSLNDQDFSAALSQAFEHKLGTIEKIDPRFSFPLTAQHAKHYYQQRVVIVGDAAHSIHPLAGLGVNLGFLDAATLAQELKRASDKQIDLGHQQVLRRYQRQRKSHTYATAGLMETLKRGFDSSNPLAVLARNSGMSFINQLPLLKRPIILAALGDLGTPLPIICQPELR